MFREHLLSSLKTVVKQNMTTTQYKWSVCMRELSNYFRRHQHEANVHHQSMSRMTYCEV